MFFPAKRPGKEYSRKKIFRQQPLDFSQTPQKKL